MTTGVPADLSASVNGLPILIAATTSGGATDVHTATSDTDTWDEVFLWAWNIDGSTSHKLTLMFGSGVTTTPIEQNLPAETGAWLILPGLRVHGGVLLEAFADLTNVVVVGGYVNRLAA